ncbi:MAG: hypothetical protein HZB39_14025 [Planctomycetes bacterium]|nr:hypothetical protein [Planctomycetota bacterium]
MFDAQRAAIAALFLAWLLPAQDVTPPVTQDPTPTSTPQPAADPSATVQGTRSLGRVERAGTTLRCFPTAHSPAYDETLGEGDVVELTGEEQSGFRAVRLPLGVAGFVHKDFATIADDGMVRSKGARVAFRYRATSKEAPVRFVDEGTEFRLLAEDGDWLRVRASQQVAWVPGDAVLAFSGNETVEAAWQSFAKRQGDAVEAAATSRKAKIAAVAELEATRTRLAALGESLKAEMLQPNQEQDFAALRADLQKLADGLPAEAAERRDAERMLAEIDRQLRALEMMRIVNEPAKPTAPLVAAPGPERDPLGGAQTGWLRVSRPLFGSPSIAIEKGGQVLFQLTCSTGRYPLEVFDGMEVAVHGNAMRADAESLRMLDVTRLEVLGRARR